MVNKYNFFHKMDDSEHNQCDDNHIQILHTTFLLIGFILFIWLLLVLSDNDTDEPNQT